MLDPAARRDYTEFVTAAFEGARPTVASALARAVPRARFAGLASELGFAAGALPSELGADQWAGLFLVAGPARGASRAGPSRSGPSRNGSGAGPSGERWG